MKRQKDLGPKDLGPNSMKSHWKCSRHGRKNDNCWKRGIKRTESLRIPQMVKREQVPSCFQNLEEAFKHDSELAGFELKLVEALVRDEVHTTYWEALEEGDRKSFAGATASLLHWAGFSLVSSLLRWQSIRSDKGGVRKLHKEAVQLCKALLSCGEW